MMKLYQLMIDKLAAFIRWLFFNEVAFCKWMLWCLHAEIKIARSTGRDPRNVEQLNTEIHDYELQLLRLQLL